MTRSTQPSSRSTRQPSRSTRHPTNTSYVESFLNRLSTKSRSPSSSVSSRRLRPSSIVLQSIEREQASDPEYGDEGDEHEDGYKDEDKGREDKDNEDEDEDEGEDEDEEMGDEEDYPPRRRHRHHPIPPPSAPRQQRRRAMPLPSSPGQLPNRPVAGPSPPPPLSNRGSSIRSGIRRSATRQPPGRASTRPSTTPQSQGRAGIRPNTIHSNDQILFRPLTQSPYFEPDPMDEDARTFHSENTMGEDDSQMADDTQSNATRIITLPKQLTTESILASSGPPLLTLPSPSSLKAWVEAPPDTRTRLARRLLYVLYAGPVACPLARHDAQEEQHYNDYDEHHSIRHTYCAPDDKSSPLLGRPSDRTHLYRTHFEPPRGTPAETSCTMGLHRRAIEIPPEFRNIDRAAFPLPIRCRSMFQAIAAPDEAFPSLFPTTPPPNPAPAPAPARVPSVFSTPGRTPAATPAAPPAASRSRICLHTDSHDDAKLFPPTFDVDSSLSIFTDLALFRGSLCLSPGAQPTKNLSKSLHVTVPIETDEGTLDVPIHTVPHTVFGTYKDHPLYIFFPRAYRKPEVVEGSKRKSKVSVHLSNEQHKLFFDRVLSPAILALGCDTAQHHPTSFEHLNRAAQAYRAEAHGDSSSRGGTCSTAFNPQSLAKLWMSIRGTLGTASMRHRRTPELYQFGTPFFFYDCKNTKVQFRSYDSVDACVTQFTHELQACLPALVADPDQLPAGCSQYVDLGAEFLPQPATDPASHVPMDRHGLYDPPATEYTVLARRCCQTNALHFIAGHVDYALGLGPPADVSGPAPPLRGSVAEYPLHFLQDCIAITWEPKRRLRPRNASPDTIREDGLVYVQIYHSSKELLDANGTYPFQHNSLPHLG